MIGSFVTRGLVMLLGYTYPAYECFKTVEKNKPEIEQLRFWCQYWIIVAFLTVFERIGDAFVSWLPMYGEAKLAFFVYLWCPKTKGAVYVYETFLQPYVARHEIEIDRNLLELRTRAGDMAVMYCQKVAKYGQTQVFEILQYVASRSSASRTNQPHPQPQPQTHPQPQPQQPQQSNPPYVRPSQVATAAARQPVARQQQQPQREPLLRQTSSAAGQRRGETNQPVQQASGQPQKEQPPSQPTPSTPLLALPPPQRSSSGQTLPPPQRTSSGKSISDTREASGQVTMPPSAPGDAEITEAEATSAETLPASENGAEKAPPAEDVVMEDAIRITRARLRRTRVVKQNGV